MKNYLLSITLLLSFTACNNSSTFCDLPEDSRPEWMNELISELEQGSVLQYQYIISGKFEGQQVFALKNCCPNCASIFIVYNCSGEELGAIGGKIEEQDITQQEIYWAPTESACSFNND